MKKTNFVYAAAIMMACAFGMTSCQQSEDNPVPTPPEPEVQYETTTYDFAAVAEAGQNPTKLNGNQSQGQAFPWWENADDPDRDRNGYKGYKWEEGSLLPEACHVWLFNSQINNNVKEGGLWVTQNTCAVAIDGIQAGSKVQIFYNPAVTNETQTTDLKDVKFYGADRSLGDVAFGKDAQTTGEITPIWVVGESTGQPYGDGNVDGFADLSAYSKLIVTVTEGEPRFLLNRDIANGNWDAEQANSHLIESPKGDDVWSAKYFSVEDKGDGTKVYTVDLAMIYQDFGWVHLHAIKGANWQNCTVTSMTLESTVQVVSTDQMIWAVGDGSKCNNGTPLSTALVDGVAAAVSGETVVPSGATIEVLTASPYIAEGRNSLAHIVVKAKKNMVIIIEELKIRPEVGCKL